MSLNCSTIFEQTLIINQNSKQAKQILMWASLNFVVLAIILYDLSIVCPLYLTYVQYTEYAIVFILSVNIFYYLVKYFVLTMRIETTKSVLKSLQSPPKADVTANKPQASSNRFTPIRMSSSVNTPNTSLVGTPINTSAASWRSNGSSPNRSLVEGSYMYRTTPTRTTMLLPPKDAPTVEHITDANTLNEYLKDFSKTEKLNSTFSIDTSTNILSSFWSHPVAKGGKDNSSFLRRSFYQLSTHSPTNKSPSTKSDEKSSPSQVKAQGMEMWQRLGVDMTRLTLWKENLRLWISKTILERLLVEFDSVNEELQKLGFGDIAIGGVGLDRLRKTGQMSHVVQNVPSLSTLLQFLEITPNQEYLVKRIRELAKGGCMSDFKWNGGSSYNGKEWDYSLPTDSAIIMHFFLTYLDTQLMPLPNKPDARPFSSNHYIKFTDVAPQLSPNTLAIQQVSEKPPHNRVIVGQEVFELQGYNNLFDSILFFLYHVNKKEHGMLGQVNLGKAGLNMLWIIERG